MQDTANNIIDTRLSEALETYFNGVTLKQTVGDCAILTGVRKQNGAPVAIYTPNFNVSKDDAAVSEISKAFARYEKIGSPRLQAVERLLTARAFKKMPALAVLACPVPVFDEAFDTLPVEARLAVFDQVLEGIAVLHSAGLVHGNISPDVVRRESDGGLLRLTELTFSGDRPTTVASQPPAYQSRHVINNAQPRAEDDVHAAGMLGYRILLGPDGPARVLAGGPSDDEALIAAVLGEPRDALTAEDLFPEGHPKAEQIARLLARMIGRLENAAPYSSAEAARRAFQTVLSGQPEPEIPVAAASPAPMAQTIPTAAPSAKAGVSAVTAVMLFGGFLVGTGAATYLYVQNGNLTAERDAYAARLSAEITRFGLVQQAQTSLRDADRVLASGLASGAAVASVGSSNAIEAARAGLAEADAVLPDAPETANELAVASLGQAQSALTLLYEARSEAETNRDTTAKAAQMAHLATGGSADLDQVAALSDEANTLFSALKYGDASARWSDAIAQYEALVQTAQGAADTAKSMLADRPEGPAPAAAILGKSYEDRATSAYADGRYSEAERLFHAAFAAYGTAPGDQPATTAETRSVTVGDSPEALQAAIQLCQEAAPVTSTCPAERDPGEAQRMADLSPFELDETEVSAAQFKAFVDATGYVTEAESNGKVVAPTSSGEARLIQGDYTWATPNGAESSIETAPNLPVTNIALKDAHAYCDWAGGRLPTEAEWEATARGTTTAAFPWGAWSADGPIWRGAETPARRLPTPVTQTGGAAENGHQGLSGNAREWVLAPEGGVLKGGSWNTANPADLRISARLIVPGNAPGVDFGFRCARDLEAWP